jgi:tripartite-type tricarboxylate transporter receptor subunit TctC
MRNYRRFVVTALIVSFAAVSSVQAQDYPSRMVRLVVPQAAGGGTDTFARAIGQKLAERWGQSVVIENKAGAGGRGRNRFRGEVPSRRIHIAGHL